jgi:hypothetical protein
LECVEEEVRMEQIVQSYRFGPHRVDVVRFPDDEGGGYVVVAADGMVITETPLGEAPSLEDVVHVYAQWQERVRET